MIPPRSSGLLGQTLKTFVFAATLPLTIPYFVYKFIRGDLSFLNKWDPFDFKKNNQQYYYQDPRYDNYHYDDSQYQDNRGYGRRMEWRHIPGFGWQYVEVEYGPRDHYYENNYTHYEDFEDFFRSSQQQQQQQQQSWNYEDIFGTQSGMTRQEAYKILGLQ